LGGKREQEAWVNYEVLRTRVRGCTLDPQDLGRFEEKGPSGFKGVDPEL